MQAVLRPHAAHLPGLHQQLRRQLAEQSHALWGDARRFLHNHRCQVCLAHSDSSNECRWHAKELFVVNVLASMSRAALSTSLGVGRSDLKERPRVRMANRTTPLRAQKTLWEVQATQASVCELLQTLGGSNAHLGRVRSNVEGQLDADVICREGLGCVRMSKARHEAQARLLTEQPKDAWHNNTSQALHGLPNAHGPALVGPVMGKQQREQTSGLLQRGSARSALGVVSVHTATSMRKDIHGMLVSIVGNITVT